MTVSDFRIGMRFRTPTGEWLVTDVGSRVVVAIPARAGWMEGPPYAATEVVFDEDDLLQCELSGPTFS
jgi:hypothetical protein